MNGTQVRRIFGKLSYGQFLSRFRLLSTSVTRLSNLWKFQEIDLLTKVAQKLVDFLGYFEKVTLSKNCCGIYLGNF